MLDPQELSSVLEEIEEMIRDLWQSALIARNAAQEVLDKKQVISLRLTKIAIENAQKNIAARKK